MRPSNRVTAPMLVTLCAAPPALAHTGGVIGGVLAAALSLASPAIIASALIAGCQIVLNAMAPAHLGAGWLRGVPLRVAGSWVAVAAILVRASLSRGALGVA